MQANWLPSSADLGAGYSRMSDRDPVPKEKSLPAWGIFVGSISGTYTEVMPFLPSKGFDYPPDLR